MLGPTDKITTEKLGDLFIGSPSGVLAGSVPTSMNAIWWATLDCAINLGGRYGGLVTSVPAFYPQVWNRVTFSPSTMWYLNIGGVLINAAELAQTFVHYPEDRSEGTADRYNKILIGMYQAGG